MSVHFIIGNDNLDKNQGNPTHLSCPCTCLQTLRWKKKSLTIFFFFLHFNGTKSKCIFTSLFCSTNHRVMINIIGMIIPGVFYETIRYTGRNQMPVNVCQINLRQTICRCASRIVSMTKGKFLDFFLVCMFWLAFVPWSWCHVGIVVIMRFTYFSLIGAGLWDHVAPCLLLKQCGISRDVTNSRRVGITR